MANIEQQDGHDFMVWGIAFVLGGIFLYCLPKIVLIFAICGLVLGYANIKGD